MTEVEPVLIQQSKLHKCVVEGVKSSAKHFNGANAVDPANVNVFNGGGDTRRPPPFRATRCEARNGLRSKWSSVLPLMSRRFYFQMKSNFFFFFLKRLILEMLFAL